MENSPRLKNNLETDLYIGKQIKSKTTHLGGKEGES